MKPSSYSRCVKRTSRISRPMSAKRTCAVSNEEDDDWSANNIKRAFISDVGRDSEGWVSASEPSTYRLCRIHKLAIEFHWLETARVKKTIFGHPLVVSHLDSAGPFFANESSGMNIASARLVMDLHLFEREEEENGHLQLPYALGELLRGLPPVFALSDLRRRNTDAEVFPIKSIFEDSRASLLLESAPTKSGGAIQLELGPSGIYLRYGILSTNDEDEEGPCDVISLRHHGDRISPRACLDLILRKEKDLLQPRWNAVDSGSNEVLPPELVDIIMSYETFSY